jgi:plasmid maintenance system antidote protein VapI
MSLYAQFWQELVDRRSGSDLSSRRAAYDPAGAYGLLKRKRTELRSDAALADFLGVTRSYVTYLLNGKRPITEPLRIKLEG